MAVIIGADDLSRLRALLHAQERSYRSSGEAVELEGALSNAVREAVADAEIESQREVALFLGTGGDPALAPRLSAALDLRGPSLVVPAFCASSLVAVHHAVAALERGECDYAIAAAAHAGGAPEASSFISPTGFCRPFDARADGYVSACGAGAVVLTTEARAARHRSRARVLGTAVLHAGSTGKNLTLSLDAHQAVLERALLRASVEPQSIGAVEAHAVGSRLDDAIEVMALARALDPGRARPASVALSSTKAVLGHREAAAGMAAIQAMLLAFEAGVLHPLPRDFSPNLGIELERTPFFFVDRARPWTGPRRAAVLASSQHGLGACAILEGSMARSQHGERVEAAPFAAAATDQLERALLSLFQSVVPERPLSGAAARFLVEGFDSLALANMTQALERVGGAPLPPTFLFEHGSVATLAAALVRERGQAAARIAAEGR